MTILVVGATGMVGSQTVPRLIERGVTVRCMTRSAEKAAALPKPWRGGGVKRLPHRHRVRAVGIMHDDLLDGLGGGK